jgi:hypothetical protein
MNERLTLNVSLKTQEDIEEAVTPEHTDTVEAYDCSILIKQKTEEDRRLRRDWHRLESKRLLNTGTQATQ